MAWLDDRAWCHPKLVDLSDKAFRVYVNGISYSSGMGLRGRLSPQQQRLLGADAKIAKQIVDAGLWHFTGNGAVEINDWDEHNGKRDERRAADRIRKREARAKERMSAGQSTGQSLGRSTGAAHVEGSEGSEGINQRPLGGNDEPRPLRAVEEAPDGPVERPGEDHGSGHDPAGVEPDAGLEAEVLRVRAVIQEQLAQG